MVLPPELQSPVPAQVALAVVPSPRGMERSSPESGAEIEIPVLPGVVLVKTNRWEIGSMDAVTPVDGVALILATTEFTVIVELEASNVPILTPLILNPVVEEELFCPLFQLARELSGVVPKIVEGMVCLRAKLGEAALWENPRADNRLLESPEAPRVWGTTVVGAVSVSAPVAEF